MIKYIHVAGTNGKGSVCEFITASLIKTGYKTGKFTSPHIFDVTERITINDIPIPKELIPDLPPNRWFETLWETAMVYFEEQEVNYAVIETGIGGLYDCTNIITPAVSVITKIALDHTDLLGDSISEIAKHKAGIIKPGIPVVTDPTQSESAMRVIRETAQRNNSRLFIPDLTDIPKVSMLGEHQKYNALVAAEALRVLGITEHDFTAVHVPARFQIVSNNPLIIVDGAHNPSALRATRKAAEAIETTGKRVIIIGMLKSKDYRSGLENLIFPETEIIFTDGFSENAVPVSELKKLCENAHSRKSIKEAIDLARSIAGEGGLILICGSLYLAAEALKELL
ncbi:MAG: bifunctional folylpolyglutamate synthase/dihydrofolate synthase [Oscillospiraceae bacterium]|nr:bifunctional folylpolyglutamate synthase/dihydrofolate synthase [Oscillospiraceae bacterium]